MTRSRPLRVLLLGISLPLSVLAAQKGDNPNEKQPPLPESLEIPAAPALSPAEALKSFRLAPGISMELVASEPLVQDPVCMAFDPDGRIWVAEMMGYMPNVDGEGEAEPVGRIGVLSDEDGDGVYESRVNFLEGLVLPRAVLPYRDGALVIVPPILAFYRDTDGDGVADSREVIARGLGGVYSPEHAINALRWTQDNWIQCSNHSLRFRETEDGWITQRTGGGGQWGMAFDEEGRAFFNTNSDGLRGDTFSSHYAVRNSNYGKASGMNVRVAQDQTVWPARMNTGVNRGYNGSTLREDYTLHRFTGACGPLVYLGANFPKEYHGNAFVAEPCGNLIKRYSLQAKGELGVEALNVYGGREFIASTDERFRPVNLYDGPDGALYVVDMYRGLIQHRIFVTSWLRKQVLERGLEQPTGRGRIWRVKHSELAEHASPQMSEATWSELTAALHSANGWWRLSAQRLLVEEGVEDADAIELTRKALTEGKTALGRVHALWALSGLGTLDEKLLLAGLRDDDPRVIYAAVRCAEEWLSTGNQALLERFRELGASATGRLKRQLIFSLGEAKTKAGDRLLADWMLADASSSPMRSALLSGLAQRELPFLLDLDQREGWRESQPGRQELVRDLARCIATEQRHASLAGLFTLIAESSEPGNLDWRSSALIEGALAGRPKNGMGKQVPMAMALQPKAIEDLRRLAKLEPKEVELEVGEAAKQKAKPALTELLKWITWPGGPHSVGEALRELTAVEQARFEQGRDLYANTCAGCHQGSGRGAGGLAPSLRFSPWLLEDRKTPIRILLGGLNGEIEVHGQTWNMEMPVYAASPADIAAVLTYARREWGNGAEPISESDVLEIVKEMQERESMWTAEELKAAQERERKD
jgi:glucose/arabinose dehydrogenase/mono/diheme cytochrome c family protein